MGVIYKNPSNYAYVCSYTEYDDGDDDNDLYLQTHTKKLPERRYSVLVPNTLYIGVLHSLTVGENIKCSLVSQPK